MEKLYQIRHIYTLDKDRRLKGRKKISDLFESGKTLRVFPLKVVYNSADVNDDSAVLQTGFSVSKKIFKHAVKRNRVKRLMREAWRLNSTGLRRILSENKSALSVFIIYTGNELPDFHLVETKMKIVIAKLTDIAGNDLKPKR